MTNDQRPALNEVLRTLAVSVRLMLNGAGYAKTGIILLVHDGDHAEIAVESIKPTDVETLLLEIAGAIRDASGPGGKLSGDPAREWPI